MTKISKIKYSYQFIFKRLGLVCLFVLVLFVLVDYTSSWPQVWQTGQRGPWTHDPSPSLTSAGIKAGTITPVCSAGDWMRGFIQLTHIPYHLWGFFLNYCFGIVSICHLCSSALYRAEEGVIFPGNDVTDSYEPSSVGVGNLIPVL